ncbi:MAG: histidine kinase dimerization/phospho-acceptor domain-containing protein [Bacteroidota bacterium]
MDLSAVTSDLGRHVRDAVLITEAEPIDAPGPRIVWANPAFTDMTGYTLEEVIGRTPRLLQGPDTDLAALKRIRVALEAWQPVREVLKNYTKEGKPFFVELAIKPIADETGWFRYWVSVQRDVTAWVEQEEEFRRAREEAESANRMKSEFLANMSHEIRTPLNGVLGMAQLLQLMDLDEEQQGAVSTIISSGQSLLGLIDDIHKHTHTRLGIHQWGVRQG